MYTALIVLPVLLAAANPWALPQQDPQPVPLVVEVVSLDGAPIVGARVGVQPIEAGRHDGMRNGWLAAHTLELARLTAAHHWATDDQGLATVAWPGDPRGRYELSIAPPHRLLSTQPGERAQRRLVVQSLAAFVVRVVDTDGAPIPLFPVGLYGNQQLRAVARTDASGAATFGVDPRYEARLAVVPFGWVGPHAGFPTVAQQLPGGVTTLAVPPHGRLVVRTLVRGRPAPAAVRSVALTAPVRLQLGRSRDVDAVDCHGAIFDPVPLGEPVRGELRVRRLVVPFTAPALRVAGQELVVDVETEPPSPQFTARLFGAPPDLVLTRIAVHTDAGMFLDAPRITGDRVHARFDGTEWLGERVRRVELTGVAFARGELAQGYCGSVEVDLPLTATLLDAGTLVMHRTEPTLRGRVVDELGAPVAGALVEVHTAAGGSPSWRITVTCDQQGCFALHQPIRVPQAGVPLQFVATARSPLGADVGKGKPSLPQPVGSEVELVLGASTHGYLQVAVLDAADLHPSALRFVYTTATGEVIEVPPTNVRPVSSRSGQVRLGPLPVGSGRLRVLLRSGAAIAESDPIELTAPIAPISEPLEPVMRIEGGARIRRCRMRIVDEAGIPILGAMVSVRNGLGAVAIGASDESGCTELLFGVGQRVRVDVAADGRQPLAIDDPIDGGQVQLLPRRSLCVAVAGLPDDLPRDRIEVMFRPVVRDNLFDATQGRLGVGDTAAVPWPRDGSYRLLLVVRSSGRADRDGGSGTWSQVGEHNAPVAIAADQEPGVIAFAVDEATVARLRAELAVPAK